MKKVNLQISSWVTELQYFYLSEEKAKMLEELSWKELQDVNIIELEEEYESDYICGIPDETEINIDVEDEDGNLEELGCVDIDSLPEAGLKRNEGLEKGNYLVVKDVCKGGFVTYPLELEDDEEVDIDNISPIPFGQDIPALFDDEIHYSTIDICYKGKPITGEDDSCTCSKSREIYLVYVEPETDL